jgi:hypothetical protein
MGRNLLVDQATSLKPRAEHQLDTSVLDSDAFRGNKRQIVLQDHLAYCESERLPDKLDRPFLISWLQADYVSCPPASAEIPDKDILALTGAKHAFQVECGTPCFIFLHNSARGAGQACVWGSPRGTRTGALTSTKAGARRAALSEGMESTCCRTLVNTSTPCLLGVSRAGGRAGRGLSASGYTLV